MWLYTTNKDVEIYLLFLIHYTIVAFESHFCIDTAGVNKETVILCFLFWLETLERWYSLELPHVTSTLNLLFNPKTPSVFPHPYKLAESTFILGVSVVFSQFCNQNSHRWDVAFCAVTSGALLFAYDP